MVDSGYRSRVNDERASRAGSEDIPGGEAQSPTQIPARGWRHVARRGWREANADHVSLLSAGVAFFGFLALFPALVAFTLIWGIVADPTQIASQTAGLTASLPSAAKQLLTEQLQQLASAPAQALGWGTFFTLALAVWSASGGIGNLVAAITIAYDEESKRGIVRQRLIALGLTVGGIIFMALVAALVAGVPLAFGLLHLAGPWRWIAEVVRWVVVALLVMVALAVLYRVAPDRDAPKFRWVTTGAAVATALWLAASALFSLYVSTVGSYTKTYGALAGIVILLLWLWITSYAILLGAEINAESEEQTAKDTTRGPEKPLGTRGAVKADTVPHE